VQDKLRLAAEAVLVDGSRDYDGTLLGGMRRIWSLWSLWTINSGARKSISLGTCTELKLEASGCPAHLHQLLPFPPSVT
jgi:hypothetical protein